MRSTIGICLLAMALPAMTPRATAGEVKFAAGPTATKAGDKVTIAFAVSAPTDVEAAVLGADGKVVRHLAAGVLGAKNPPPEPLKPGLAQRLEWDGRDDLGKPAGGGPFKVQVRAGMGVKFGRIIGGDPYTGVVSAGGPASSLAVDADGTLYVKMGSFTHGLANGLPWQLRKFDKAGKYVKTLLPYAPSTAPGKAPGFRQIDAGDGLLTPANDISSLYPVLFSFGDNIHNKVVDGQVIFIDNASARLTLFKADGSNAVKTVPMRTAPDKLKWPNWLSPQVAFSPDGKYAYYSNVANTPYDGKKPADIDPNFPQGRVYRQDLTKPGSNPEKFYDLELPDFEKTKYWMPSAWDKKTAAAGIAVDAKGNLFVCDLVNQEVVEVSPEGKKLGSARVPWPDQVLVNSKTGTLYVVSTQVSRGGRPPSELLKVTGRGADAKVVARLPLGGGGDSLAIDESGEVPVVWVGGGDMVVRVEDRGAALAVGDNFLNRNKDLLPLIFYLAVDAEAELVYASDSRSLWRYNGETGEGGPTPIKTVDVAIGPGGLIYAWGEGWPGPIYRYTRDLKPAPLAASGKHIYGSIGGRAGRGSSIGGIGVDPRGWAYIYNSIGGGFPSCVTAFDADGKPAPGENGTAGFGLGDKAVQIPLLVAKASDCGGGIRVDAKGNIYLGQPGYPKDFGSPKGFENDGCYKACGGSVIKFGPKGGEGKQPNGPVTILGFKGVLQTYPGVAPMSGAMAVSCCNCQRPRFDLDGYGRLYIPNALTYRVSVRDNNDNEIVQFGGYGNLDARGPASQEPRPEIPLGWATAVGASDKHIYVGDVLNHRVVRANKTWAAEATAVVP